MSKKVTVTVNNAEIQDYFEDLTVKPTKKVIATPTLKCEDNSIDDIILFKGERHLWKIPHRNRQGRTFPYIMSVQVSIVEETFTLKIVLVKDVSTIPFCENYLQVFRLSK